MTTRTNLPPLVLYLPWVAKSPNQCSGVVAKIAHWKKCASAWDTALRSCLCGEGWLMNTTTCPPRINPSLIALRKVSASKVTPIQGLNGITHKSP